MEHIVVTTEQQRSHHRAVFEACQDTSHLDPREPEGDPEKTLIQECTTMIARLSRYPIRTAPPTPGP